MSEVFTEGSKLIQQNDGSVFDDAATVQVQAHTSAMPEVRAVEEVEINDGMID